MSNKNSKHPVVLLSGGLDSAVTLYIAKQQGYSCKCLIFNYGQRHKREIECARRIAKAAKFEYRVLKINFPWKGSSLLDKRIKIPKGRDISCRENKKIPSTYVPGRNIIFLSFAISFAESVSAEAVFIGAHTQDYSDYPDCRKEFFLSFSKVIKTGTRLGVEGKEIKILTPLINRGKAEIIKLGISLGVPFGLTWSCYNGGSKPCGKCDSCRFRAKGFQEAGRVDPLIGVKKRGR